MNKFSVKKNYYSTDIDFNSIANLISSNNYESIFSSYWLNNHVLNSVFQIRNVENSLMFNTLFNKLNFDFNKNKLKSDLSLFLNFFSGASSHVHKDEYSVCILGLYGKTYYKIDNAEIIIEKGDCVFIPKEITHQAISLNPRIIASFGIYDN